MRGRVPGVGARRTAGACHGHLRPLPPVRVVGGATPTQKKRAPWYARAMGTAPSSPAAPPEQQAQRAQALAPAPPTPYDMSQAVRQRRMGNAAADAAAREAALERLEGGGQGGGGRPGAARRRGAPAKAKAKAPAKKAPAKPARRPARRQRGGAPGYDDLDARDTVAGTHGYNAMPHARQEPAAGQRGATTAQAAPPALHFSRARAPTDLATKTLRKGDFDALLQALASNKTINAALARLPPKQQQGARRH